MRRTVPACIFFSVHGRFLSVVPPETKGDIMSHDRCIFLMKIGSNLSKWCFFEGIEQ